jgi:hypothetical protein
MTKENPKTEAELVKLIEKRVAEKKQIAVVAGAFGDMEECEAVVEEFIYPTTGGSFTKFYGCSYLFKGVPLREIVEGLSMAKSMISFLPREIFFRGILFRIAILLYALFMTKRFMNYLMKYCYIIHAHSINRVKLPITHYNKFTNELRRSFESAVRDKNDDFYKIARYFADFIYLFLEYDNAYRLRIQDMFENLNAENAEKNVRKEVLRLIDILIDREYGIKDKWIQMRRIFNIFLIISPKFRNLMREFLTTLTKENVVLDEDDWYFCLRRNGYRFRDMPVEARLEEKARIDSEKGHILLRLRPIESPKE